MYMPIKVVHGKKAGPTILVIAAMHGNEINGTDIVNRLLNLPALKRLSGTLIAVPVLNVYGLINRSRYLPGNIDIDTCFPGSEIGSNASRLAHIFKTEIFDKADYCIDLQTGPINHSNLPQLFIDFSDSKAKELAESFNTPVALDSKCTPGSLRSVAKEQGISYLTYEAGEAMRFDSHTIKIGLQGIVNVMRKLQMLPEKHSKKDTQSKTYFAEKHIWIHSPASGISYSKCKLGQFVKRNETLSTVKDPFGVSHNTDIKSPHDGVIVGMNNLPLVHEGEGVFQVAAFTEMRKTANELEEWQENIEEQPSSS